MPSRLQDPDEYEIVNQNSFKFDGTLDLDNEEFQSNGTSIASYSMRERQLTSIRGLLSRLIPFRLKKYFGQSRILRRTSKVSRRIGLGILRPSRRCCSFLYVLVGIIIGLVLFTAVFSPSYTNPPAHYKSLRERVKSSNDYGRANPENVKVFVAASIYDKGGHLLKGAWGEAVLELLNILGNRNVFLSIYENESGEAAEVAQIEFERKLQCEHSLVYDKFFSSDDAPHTLLPDGSERVKRIAYLAEVRNKALEPLVKQPGVEYDRLLFLNDVVFDPVEAAQLLLSTNHDEHGRATYRAVCAVDFINPFKLYDTFATRDLNGYSMGVPFFPWFTTSKDSLSRQEVLQGKDAVRVKSCWGGMVAFDANPFQSEKPLRFRATNDTFWDASECCLIHADLGNQGLINDEGVYVGIYMNPFVRVAYDTRTLWWLSVCRRFERLYTLPHNIINHLVGLPRFNPRRADVAGTKVDEEVWMPDSQLKEGGVFHKQTRESSGDGFCGIRMLQVIVENQQEGQRNWEMMPIPPG